MPLGLDERQDALDLGHDLGNRNVPKHESALGFNLKEQPNLVVTVEIEGEKKDFELPAAAARALQEIADRNGLTLEAALEQAITNEKFFEEQIASGAKVLVEKDDQVREVEFA